MIAGILNMTEFMTSNFFFIADWPKITNWDEMYAIEEPPVDYDAANELISETTDRSFDEA